MSIQKCLQGELHKITREINQYGENYVFWRDDVDKYGEPTGTTRNIADVKGIYRTFLRIKKRKRCNDNARNRHTDDTGTI